MSHIFECQQGRIKYGIIVFGLIFFAAIPYLSLMWKGFFVILLVALSSYSGQLKGALMATVWAMFAFEFWGSLSQFYYVVLITQGVIFGLLFKHQSNLKQDLKEKSENLKEEKEMFDQILETAVDGFFMLDQEGNFIKINQTYQEMTGYSEEKLVSMNINDMDITESKLETQNHIGELIDEEKDKFESWHRTKDGGIINLEITTTYVDDIRDGVFVSFARDITERKEREKRLKASEAKFRSYIQNAPYGIFVLNGGGEYVEVNPTACRLIGYSEQEIIGCEIGTIGEVVNKEVAQNYFLKLKKQERAEKEVVFNKSNGIEIDVEINGVKINNDNYIIFAQDISQRKNAERKIKAERDKLKKYFEITQAIVLRLDENQKIREINKNGCQILDCTREEAIGSNWFETFVKEEDRPKSERVFRKGFEEKEVINGENTLVTKSGEEKDIFWHNNILTNEAGEVVGSLSLGVDVTEIKSLREELEHSKLQMQFFANLSHELKTPLNLIFSAQQMLKLEQQRLSKERRDKFEKYLDVISQNGNRLLRLVNNLLDINKFEADAFKLNFGNHDLVKIVENVIFSIAEYVEQKERKFEFESDVEEKVLKCDPFNLERVLLNLLSNAIKFTEKEDKIKVKIVELERKVRIIVKDTGVGIPESKQDVIFKRFGQVDKSLSRNNEGSGIGLSIVRLIIDAHNGEIKVNSEYGVGSEFIIDLPVTKADNGFDGSNYQYNSQQLIDRINMELSDIYN